MVDAIHTEACGSYGRANLRLVAKLGTFGKAVSCIGKFNLPVILIHNLGLQ